MAPPNQQAFLEIWPKCFINFLAVIEVITVIILIITELGNVAANFWLTNVFAGGWCGLIMLIHLILVLISGCCAPGPASAFRAAVVAVIGLIATATLISFDAAFIAQPSTCVLTSSCVDNSVSNTTFSYSFQQSFFAVFNSWAPFKSYGQTQVKFLCQTIQVGVGGLCFILCIIYLVLYYTCSSKAKQQVGPGPPEQQPGYYPPPQQPGYYPPPQQPGYYPPPQQPYYPMASPPPLAQQGYYPAAPSQQSMYPSLPQQQYYQPTAPNWRAPSYVPQPPPGAIPWNGRKY